MPPSAEILAVRALFAVRKGGNQMHFVALNESKCNSSIFSDLKTQEQGPIKLNYHTLAVANKKEISKFKRED